MTHRERREAKAARLREWARKRQEAAAATLKAGEVYRGDHAFNFQPGHIPLRARVIAREDRAFESLEKARRMEARADGIEAAAARAVYSDDPDAVEALEAKIAGLEAERARVKAYNASCRREARDFRLLDEQQRAALLSCVRHTPWSVGPNGEMPSYVSANLSGNLSRLRRRLESLRKEGDR